MINTISTVVAIMAGICAIITAAVKAKRALKARRQKETEFREKVLKALEGITEDVANIEGEILTQAHEQLIKQGWCSADRKQSLQARYESYKAKGRNHLKQHYIEEIIALPEHKI